MKVPKYIQEIMYRSRFDTNYLNPKSCAGYTFIARKKSPYTKIYTFKEEIDRMIKWARKNYAEAEILELPTETHYCNQYALVTITDPCMKFMEVYMKENINKN